MTYEYAKLPGPAPARARAPSPEPFRAQSVPHTQRRPGPAFGGALRAAARAMLATVMSRLPGLRRNKQHSAELVAFRRIWKVLMEDEGPLAALSARRQRRSARHPASSLRAACQWSEWREFTSSSSSKLKAETQAAVIVRVRVTV